MDYPELLKLAPEYHRAWDVCDEPDPLLRVNSHRAIIRYSSRMGGALQRLGLYQIARLNDCLIDRALITALVERWRLETNTFHMPVGEVTVTLEDVACLWGLPIDGNPVTGTNDTDWSPYVEEDLGVDMTGIFDSNDNMPWKYRWYDLGTPNERLAISGFSLRLKWLRDKFDFNLDDDDVYYDDETVAQYTQGFCMDLFGSVMFPDSSSDGVPAMYLQFLTDLEDPPMYNLWPQNPHTGGTSPYRCQFESLADDTVNWRPYEEYYDKLPRHVRQQRRLWMSHVYVIHFWMVEFQHADRVMRQFGKYLEVPPPPPLAWEDLGNIRRWAHTGTSIQDACWKQECIDYIMSMHYRYTH